VNLLFITSNRVGDAILSMGLLSALAARHPDARITVVCGPLPAPLFAHQPGVVRVLPMAKRRHGLHWLDLWRQVAGSFWHMVVDLRNSVTGYLVPHRRVVRLGRQQGALHVVEEESTLIGEDHPTPPRLHLSEAQKQAAAAAVPDGRPVLALGPAANWLGKQWPAARFIELAQRLTAPGAALEGAAILVTAAAHERDVAQPVLDAFAGQPTIDLIGADLPSTAAALARCRLYVGNDSGLMHMAAAVGTPTLGLFGPTDDSRYRPWGEQCDFVRAPQGWRELIDAVDSGAVPGDRLMDGVTVEMALEAAGRLLARTGPSHD
jgi:heptosyltransferase-3